MTLSTAACHGPATGHVEDAMPNIDMIVYEDSQLAMSQPETLTVRDDLTVRYESHTNWFRLPQQDIGRYATTLPRASLNELKSVLSDSAFDPLPDHRGRLGFDERYRAVRVTRGPQTIQKVVGTSGSVDPGLEAILIRLAELAQAPLRSPLAVLHVELQHVGVDDARVIELDAIFSNPGVESVQCRTPTSLGEDGGSMQVITWPDGGASRGREVRSGVHEVRLLTLTGGAVVRGRVLELPPKAAAAYHVRAMLPGADPGPAFVRLLYGSYVSPFEGIAIVTGELLATTKLVIPPAR